MLLLKKQCQPKNLDKFFSAKQSFLFCAYVCEVSVQIPLYTRRRGGIAVLNKCQKFHENRKETDNIFAKTQPKIQPK